MGAGEAAAAGGGDALKPAPLEDAFLSGFLGFDFFFAIMAIGNGVRRCGMRIVSAPALVCRPLAGVTQPKRRPIAKLKRDVIVISSGGFLDRHDAVLTSLATGVASRKPQT